MANPLSDLLAGGIQGLAETAKGIIEEFHMSPEQKAEQLAKVAAAQAQAVKDAEDYDTKMNDIAGQNIRADETSGDKFAGRARPMFMYIIEAILAWNYIGMQIVKIWVPRVGPVELPADLLALFGVCITGYVVARSFDKNIALPGTSTVSMFGGMMKGSNSSQ
jgi:hypothetical protein